MAAADSRPRYKERTQALVAVMFYMGLKPIEVFHLDVSHVSLGERLVYVVRPGGKPRTQPLEPDAELYVHRWLAERQSRVHKKTLALFTSDERIPGSVQQQRLATKTIRHDVELTAKAAGMDIVRVSPQAIRNGYIVGQLRKHVPPSIIERVLGLAPEASPSSVAELERILASKDAVRTLLNEAWNETFGTRLDPSDAYRKALGAVEAVAISRVQPRHDKATLGTVIGELRADRDRAIAEKRAPRWQLPSTTAEHAGLNDFIAMLDLIWKGQYDRHVRDEEALSRVTLEEAQMVVPLAEALVRWFRMGFVRRSGL